MVIISAARVGSAALRIVEAHLMAGALCRSALLTGTELEALLARVTPEPAITMTTVVPRTTPPEGTANPIRDRPGLSGGDGPAVIPRHRAGLAVQDLNTHQDRADNIDRAPDPDDIRRFAA